MADRQGSLWASTAVLLLGALLSILAQGFEWPGNGSSYHWPALFDWAASAEGPHDLFTRSLDHYVSHFWTAVGLLVQEDSPAWIALGLHLALRFALLAAFAWLLVQLGGAAPLGAAVLAVMIGLILHRVPSSPLGNGEVLLNNLSNATATTTFAVLSFALVFAGRFRSAALLLGLSTNVSAFAAAWGFAALAGARLWSWRGNRQTSPARLSEGVVLLLLFLLPAVPTIAWIAKTIAETAPAAAAYDFRAFLREFYPGHTMLSAAPRHALLLFAVLLAGGALSWRALLPHLEAAQRDRAVGLVAVVLFTVALGALLPWLTGNRLLLDLLPLRMDFQVVWLTMLLFLAALLREGRIQQDGWLALLALLAGQWLAWLALLARPSRVSALVPALFAVLTAALGALPSASHQPGRIEGAILLAPFLVALLLPGQQKAARRAALGLLAALGYAGSVALLPAAPRIVALPLLALALLAWPGESARRQWWAAAFTLAGLAAGLWLARADPRMLALLAGGTLAPPLAALLVARRQAPPQRSAARTALCAALLVAAACAPGLRHLAETGRLDRYGAADLAFFELQRWARAATPPDSLFLQPKAQLRPNLTPSFWTFSRRPAWVDWRQGAAAFWLPDFYWLWRQRMTEVLALPDVDAKLAYARAHAIPYVILAADEALPAGAPTALYEDGFWRVLPAN